jgi:WD40 repeat protein
MAVMLRAEDLVAQLSPGELAGIAGLGSYIVRASEAENGPPPALDEFLKRIEPSLAAADGTDVQIELSDSDQTALEFLHAQVRIRDALPVRIRHECPTCGTKTLSNPDHDVLVERSRKMSAISGIGMALSGTASPFLMVGGLLKLRKIDPDFVCPRCKELESDDAPVTFCPGCKSQRDEAVLIACADCGHDFGAQVTEALSWQPLDSIALPPPITGEEGVLTVESQYARTAVSRDGSRLVASIASVAYAATETGVTVFDLADTTAPPVQVDLTGVISSNVGAIAISADGSRVAAKQEKGVRMIGVWDITGEPSLLLHANPGDQSPAVALSPDGTRLASSGVVWNVDSGVIVRGRDRPFGSTKVSNVIGIKATAFSPDGRLLADGWLTSTIVSETETGDPVAELEHKGKEVVAVAFGADDAHLAILNNEKKPARYVVRVWNIENGEVTFLETGEGRGGALAFSPDGAHLAVAERDDRMIRVWEVSSGKETRRLPRNGFPQSLAFVAGGSRLLAAEYTGVTCSVTGINAFDLKGAPGA